MAATVNANYGMIVVDKYGALDPNRAEQQINAKVGAAKPFRHSGPLDRGINDPQWAPDALAIAMGLGVS
jgi:hypothetical protein